MNLVEYKLGNICEVLAPVGSGGVAKQFSRALSSSPPPPRPPTGLLKATLGNTQYRFASGQFPEVGILITMLSLI